MSSTVLVANSAIWPNAAHLCRACSKAGFTVEVVAPPSHPVHRMAAPNRSFIYNTWRPCASLKAAILASRPQIIIPCDDRIVVQLYHLHARARNSADADSHFLVSLIERSLGPSASYALLSTRTRLGEIAAQAGVCVPSTAMISSYRQLRAWAQSNGFPIVLKLDSSSGGRDVVIVRTPQSLPAGYATLKLRQSFMRRIKNAVWNGDPEPVLSVFRGGSRAISAQAFIAGKPANCAVACWNGRVLASIAVETIQARSDVGVATVVRCVEGRAMNEAARAIVSHLGLSGMIGLDFVIDGDGNAHLIEINPRATQINHLRESAGGGLVHALCTAASGQPIVAQEKEFQEEPIALFPQEWLRDPGSAYLSSARHDIPYDEPELLAFYGYRDPAVASSISVPAIGVDAVVLKSGDARRPVYTFPGIGGDAREVAGLAQHLQHGEMIYGMQLAFPQQRLSAAATVEEIASKAVLTIRSRQPRGPYRLLGYSFGGLVAFEAAVQLQGLGETVEFVGMIASPMSQRFWPTGILLRSIARRSAAHLAAFRKVPPRVAISQFATRARRLMALAAKKSGFNLSRNSAAAGLRRADAPARVALDLYKPGFFAGTLTVIQPKQDDEFHCDTSVLWAPHASRIETLKFPSNHLGFVRDGAVMAGVAKAVDVIVGGLREDHGQELSGTK